MRRVVGRNRVDRAVSEGLAECLDAVLAPQTQLEGLEPGLGGLAVALRGPAGLDDALDLGLDLVVGLGGRLVPLVEALLAPFLVGDRPLEAGELALRLLGPSQCGGHALLQTADLGLGGLLSDGLLGGDAHEHHDGGEASEYPPPGAGGGGLR